MDTETIQHKIDEHEIIFFDVFDTLIKRTVPKGKDVFRLVENLYDKKFFTKSDFSNKRIMAEKTAREKCTYREVNLDEIYEFLDMDVAAANILKKMELEAEADVCIANEPLYYVFQYCLQKHKSVYIVSDMYLSAEQIDYILQINGYHGYVKVYSSCDVRLTKWENGDLYKQIIQNEYLDQKKILHIGNDRNADYKKAKKWGIEAFLIPEEKNFGRYYQHSNKNFTYQCMELFIGNKLLEQNNLAYELGFEVFGPILYGFTKWLLQQCKMLNLKKLFFFSRDGYLLKKSFDLMHTDIATTYFYISRKAIITPILQFDSSFQEILNHYKSWDKTFSWQYVFKRFNIPAHVYEPILKKMGIDSQANMTLTDLLQAKDAKTIFMQLTPLLRSNSEEQLLLLKRYMNEKNFSGTLGIIDMGAGCSIEFALNELLNQTDIAVTPYYLYLHSAVESTAHRKKYLDSGLGNPRLNAMLRFCYMFLEIILAAPHGTVSGYKETDSRITPVLESNEYEVPFKGTTEAQYIEILQKGALDFVQQFQQRLGKYIDIEEADALIGFEHFGITPLTEDIRLWGDFQILLDGYTQLIASPTSSSYFLHPVRFFKDMLHNVWPAGFFMKHISCRAAMNLLFTAYLMGRYR